jgi:hypothetical protein
VTPEAADCVTRPVLMVAVLGPSAAAAIFEP